MQPPNLPNLTWSARRSIVAASIIASCTALLAASGCVSGQNGSSPNGTGTGGGTTGGSGAGGPVGGSAATSNGGSGATGNGGTAPAGGTPASGGSFTGNGGTSTGGTLPGSGGNAGTGTGVGGTGGSKPCVDVEPPPDPEWPEATCRKWATETSECTQAWFAQYCDVSCGRCVPAGSGGSGNGGSGGSVSMGGSGGTGPSGGMGGSAGKACVDVQPPPDPEWPGATCENWATETTACGESWFAQYCDVSCRRCVPAGGGGAGGGGPVDCSGEGLPNVTGGNGYATRYWDCCQTHCAQSTGHRCGQDGVSNTGNTMSSCQGGGAYACYDEAPRAVSKCLSYGHIAKSNPNCGQCYRIQFTGEGQNNVNDPGSKLIKGKQMIVKVTNTGGDVGGSQFDLMVPGGGVGQFNACSKQWGTSDLGAQYGGFLTSCTGAHSAKKECVRQQCMKIPAGSARDGCLWFVDWFEVADNPKFTSQQTNCPF